MVVFGILIALIVLLIGGAAYSDFYWRRRGFKTVVTGHGRNRTKTRIRLDPDAQLPEDPSLPDQDWVRLRDFDDPDTDKG